jgi:iron(III) transport system substrate-binding protein
LDADLSTQFPFPVLELNALQRETSLRPIRLGPGLLVYLDKYKRQNFIKAWENATLQTPQD